MVESILYKILFKNSDDYAMNCEIYEKENESYGRYLILKIDYDYVELIKENKTMETIFKHGCLFKEK